MATEPTIADVMGMYDRVRAAEGAVAKAAADDAVAEEVLASGPKDEATARDLEDRAKAARRELSEIEQSRAALAVAKAQAAARLEALRRARV